VKHVVTPAVRNNDHDSNGDTMPAYRHQLPQLTGCVFLTDGGIETTLIYDDGFDLPENLAELDAATELDGGYPADLAEQYRRLRDRHPHLRVLGGCCGTNHHHIDAIAAACVTGVRS